LPAILDSAESTLTSVKRLSDSVEEVSHELLPVVHTAETTLADVSILVRGAKQTFPFNRFAQNAGPVSKPEAALSPTASPSLRGDHLRR
jgi:phospholipid/cholesterol/gamma-HCH transport system substrate-binding protein